jgi:hypothetical protein
MLGGDLARRPLPVRGEQRGGDLTEIESSPVALPANSAPSGLVVN